MIVGIGGSGLFDSLGVDTEDDDVDGVDGGYFFELRQIIVGGKLIQYMVVYIQRVSDSLFDYSFDELSPEQREEYEQFLENSRKAFEKV